MEALPAFELHGIGPDDAADGLAVEGAIEHIQADVPARSAHRDESALDVVPEREPRAIADRLQLPAHIVAAPGELEELGGVGALHLSLGDMWLGRTHGGELRSTWRTEVPVSIERSPFAEMLGIRERL